MRHLRWRTRYTSANDTPSDRLYTGQRLEEEAGLYYYNARFYDAALAHFVQADTVVPDAGFSLSYIRYAYVNFNPIRLTDPTGHYGWGEEGYEKVDVNKWIDNHWDWYVYNILHNDNERKKNQEKIETTVKVVETVASIVIEPIDYMITARDCIMGDSDAVSLIFMFAPLIPGSFGDDVSDAVLPIIKNVTDDLPTQTHHFLTNINKKYTPLFKNIVGKYDLDLNENWNKMDLPHQGRHAHEYHDWALNAVQKIDETLGGGKDKAQEFISQFTNKVINDVVSNPEILRKSWWRK